MSEFEHQSLIQADSSTNPSMRSLESAFVTDDREAISRQEIRSWAEDLAEGLRPTLAACRTPEEACSVILIGLEAGRMLELGHAAFPEARNDGPTLEDVEAAIEPIRAAILQDLTTLLPETSIAMAIKVLSDKGGVRELDTGQAFKPGTGFESETEADRNNRLIALTDLYTIPDHRSPYLMYSIVKIDTSTQERGGAQVQQLIRFETLQDKLEADEREPGSLPAKKAFGYLRDGMRAACFLIAHNLRLSDLAPANIAIDQAADRGMLFDFDMLRQAGDTTSIYPARPFYYPPERISGAPGPIEEAQMVYEFGMGLKQLMSHYSKTGQSYPRVGLMAERMTTRDPTARPTLAGAVETLEPILAQ